MLRTEGTGVVLMWHDVNSTVLRNYFITSTALYGSHFLKALYKEQTFSFILVMLKF